ncbi:hypothetical protein E7T06_07150 [Deinococcus sp. Arct2-2]|uniref:hypothetical protein n=1 Tax=Deinococcus sp. Arct2-2 TaxID=2568653 RepID=UPI0010A34D5E|nr:hypothetical protein [Deinococcus sp. Arct2-2]THF70475.1 hypothetical protein E7T06_07150 [Deinococcus sp. Arct2-2]
MPKPPTLTTQQLKERGWTPAMIRDLLGKHDRVRQNEMRVGSRNRPVDAPVKLYLEERVLKTESTGQFARAQDVARIRQDSANQAAETRKAQNTEAVRAYVDGFTPQITGHPNAATMTHDELWRHHLDALFDWEMKHSLPRGLSKQERRDASTAIYAKYRAAVYAAYGWEDFL